MNPYPRVSCGQICDERGRAKEPTAERRATENRGWTRDYVLLTLRTAKAVEARTGDGWMLDYYGPPEWKALVEAEEPRTGGALVEGVRELEESLSGEGFEARRTRYLGKHLRAGDGRAAPGRRAPLFKGAGRRLLRYRRGLGPRDYVRGGTRPLRRGAARRGRRSGALAALEGAPRAGAREGRPAPGVGGEGGAGGEEAARYLERWALLDEEEASRSIPPMLRPFAEAYIFCYHHGRELLEPEMRGPGRDDFVRGLLTEQVCPSDLRRGWEPALS